MEPPRGFHISHYKIPPPPWCWLELAHVVIMRVQNKVPRELLPHRLSTLGTIHNKQTTRLGHSTSVDPRRHDHDQARAMPTALQGPSPMHAIQTPFI